MPPMDTSYYLGRERLVLTGAARRCRAGARGCSRSCRATRARPRSSSGSRRTAWSSSARRSSSTDTRTAPGRGAVRIHRSATGRGAACELDATSGSSFVAPHPRGHERPRHAASDASSAAPSSSRGSCLVALHVSAAGRVRSRYAAEILERARPRPSARARRPAVRVAAHRASSIGIDGHRPPSSASAAWLASLPSRRHCRMMHIECRRALRQVDAAPSPPSATRPGTGRSRTRAASRVASLQPRRSRAGGAAPSHRRSPVARVVAARAGSRR